MARTKLTTLKREIAKYLGVPYFINTPPVADQSSAVNVGKGNIKDIISKTKSVAASQNIDLSQLNHQQLYNFRKKNSIGIDCSGLAVQLLNLYFGSHLDPRKTSAAMLTSPPLSQKIDPNLAATGDLIRQKDGRHVLFVIDQKDGFINYVESSSAGRGVILGKLPISPQLALYRLAAPTP